MLEWNQVFIDTLIATNTAQYRQSTAWRHRSHPAIFDAYNGNSSGAYAPVFRARGRAPGGASRRAAVIAAAYTALVRSVPDEGIAADENVYASLRP